MAGAAQWRPGAGRGGKRRDGDGGRNELLRGPEREPGQGWVCNSGREHYGRKRQLRQRGVYRKDKTPHLGGEAGDGENAARDAGGRGRAGVCGERRVCAGAGGFVGRRKKKLRGMAEKIAVQTADKCGKREGAKRFCA